jgi:hypothetical protein
MSFRFNTEEEYESWRKTRHGPKLEPPPVETGKRPGSRAGRSGTDGGVQGSLLEHKALSVFRMDSRQYERGHRKQQDASRATAGLRPKKRGGRYLHPLRSPGVSRRLAGIKDCPEHTKPAADSVFGSYVGKRLRGKNRLVGRRRIRIHRVVFRNKIKPVKIILVNSKIMLYKGFILCYPFSIAHKLRALQ